MFNLTVGQEEFMNALKAIKGTTGKGKEAASINEKFVYMETINDAITGKPKLRLITSNTYEISDISIDVVKADIGVCSLIEYELLYNMMATIDSTIEIDLADTGDYKLTINYTGRRKPITLNCSASDDYIMPPISINQSEITLPMAVVKEGLDLGATVVHDDSKYPVFNCVSVKVDNGTVEIHAIDSMSKRMLLYRKTGVVHVNDGNFFIECTKIRKMISGFDTTKDVLIHISANNIIFEQGGLSLTARLLVGTFPDITQFIPSQYVVEVNFNRQDLLISLKRASLMTVTTQGIKSVIFNIDNGFMTINLNSAVGQLYECVIAQLTGSPVQMAFLVEPLISALLSFSDDNIKMCFYNSSCTVIMPVTSKGYEQNCLVQAVRIATI